MDAERQRLEVDRNYDAFTRMLSSILHEHRDQLALMRDGQIVGYFETPRDALKAAAELFPDGIFSIQEVTDEPIDLGFWSHVWSLNGRVNRVAFSYPFLFSRPTPPPTYPASMLGL